MLKKNLSHKYLHEISFIKQDTTLIFIHTKVSGLILHLFSHWIESFFPTSSEIKIEISKVE